MTSSSYHRPQTVSVVIPYYQREPGLLRRAIGSVLAQTGAGEVEIIVVDDASPRPAREELAGLDCPPGFRLRILTRPNGGPGRARNTGLDAVAEGSDCVAFLDSDDVWSPDHLANAGAALAAGADLYFSDLAYEGEARSGFARLDPPLERMSEPLLAERGIRRLTGEPGVLLLNGAICIQTVVYRWPKFAGLRFPVSFWRFGEDKFLLMSVAEAADTIAVSMRCEAEYGRGLSIYSDQTFGTLKNLLRLEHELRFYRAFRRAFSLTAAARALVERSATAARMDLAHEVLHQIRRGRLGAGAAAIRSDPAVLAAMAAVIGRRTRATGRAGV